MSDPQQPSNESSTNQLQVVPHTGLAKLGAGAKKLYSRMTSDLLREQALSTAVRHSIGDTWLYEPDYFAIQYLARLWAEHDIDVLEKVCGTEKMTNINWTAPSIQAGRILAICLDDSNLSDENLQTILNTTRQLRCLSLIKNQLSVLDLTPVPNLTDLRCWENQLTVLDLTPVPNLTELWCGENQLTVLDLTPVPNLTKLWCWENQLTVLDLTPVPNLTNLWCSKNQLTVLDLTPISNLTYLLWCSENQLTVLDLTPVPNLTKLWCSENQLTVLDLTPVPNLTELICDARVRLFNLPAGCSVTRF